MLRSMLLAKLHRATVTACDPNYNGSISIDKDLLEQSGMREFERVEIFNLNNGERFSTYIIEGKAGSGEIGINGAAARINQPGDKIIIVNYGLMTEEEMQNHKPIIVCLDEHNRPCKKQNS
ncbi:MAG TPA: aspartate 1-decarboxylase [Candidatus Cloacimonadota bacterium]|nr:aspartate 1-decarboxylase [Candidatus Cloacimonadota bacterium]